MSIIQSISFVLALGLFLSILKKFAMACTEIVKGSKKELLLRKRSVLAMAFMGALLTAVAQSSSIIIIMIIGLVEGKVLSERNGLAAALGTEIGTTMTGQLLSLPKELIIYIVPSIYVITLLIPKLKYLRKPLVWFLALLGAMYLMALPLNSIATNNQGLIKEVLNNSNESIVVGITIGLGFTALIQSSSALTALAINLARSGVLKLAGAIALIVGANLGTCVTGIIASFALSKSTKKIVVGQILFNLFGVLLVIMFFEPFLDLVVAFTKSSLIERQIANGQTLFNIFSFLLVLPVFSSFYKLVTKVSMKLL